MRQKPFNYLLALVGIPLAITSTSQAALIFRDSWDTSTASLDSRFERTAPSPRQTFGVNSNIPVGTQSAGIGVLTPTYAPNQAGDYHDQIVSNGTNGFLLLAGDGTAPISATSTVGIATLSPFYNFNHLDTLGNAIATDVRFTLDAFTNSPGAGSFSHAAFTIGSSGANGFNGRAESGTAAAGFSVRFVEDQFGATPNGNFIQFYDGASLVANLLPNPAGAGSMDVRLAITDSDANPWNGVGATTIEVFVNNTSVGSYTRGGGGYTDNFMTMEGSTNFVGFGLALHNFDNLEVYSIPEPSAALLGGLGVLGLLRRRRI